MPRNPTCGFAGKLKASFVSRLVTRPKPATLPPARTAASDPVVNVGAAAELSLRVMSVGLADDATHA